MVALDAKPLEQVLEYGGNQQYSWSRLLLVSSTEMVVAAFVQEAELHFYVGLRFWICQK